MSLVSIFSGLTTTSVKVVEHVDLNRYTGTWYEIARFPTSFERALNALALLTPCAMTDGSPC